MTETFVDQAALSSRLPAIIRSHMMFADLKDDAVERLIADSRILSFGAGDALVSQGEESDSALLLIEGSVTVLAETEFGRVTLTELSGVSLMGEVGVYANLTRSATIVAKTNATVLSMSRSAMLRLCYHNPDIPLRVIQQLAGRLASFNQAIATYADALSALEEDSANSRIIELLLAPPPELTNFGAPFRKMAQFISQQRQQREDMANAAAIQTALLPFPLPEDKDRRFHLDAVIKPARQVGGDFFDAFQIDADEIIVTIGDVSGKGMPASLFATVCQMVMRLVLSETECLGQALTRANALIASANRENMFATFFVGRLHLGRGELKFCNAGHVWPIVLHGDRSWQYIKGNDLPLAVLPEIPYQEQRLSLAAGDRLILCTDGVGEAVNSEGEEFGQDRLISMLETSENRTVDLARAILDTIEVFSVGEDQFDDIACVVLSYGGTP